MYTHQTEELANSVHRIIWQFACIAPQVHIITYWGATRGRANKVMNACTEAKSVGLALQLNYFCFDNHPGPFVKSFFNENVDTFWIVPHTELISSPACVEWYCGKCNASFFRIRPGPCSRCQSIPRSNIHERIHYLALDFRIWQEPDINDLPLGTMEMCQMHDVKELLLVVGDYAPAPYEEDVALVAPCQSPCLCQSQELNLPPNNGLQIPVGANTTWQDLEESLARQVEEIKMQRVKDRQAAIDCKCAWKEIQLVFNTSLAGEYSSFPEIDRYAYGQWHKIKLPLLGVKYTTTKDLILFLKVHGRLPT